MNNIFKFATLVFIASLFMLTNIENKSAAQESIADEELSPFDAVTLDETEIENANLKLYSGKVTIRKGKNGSNGYFLDDKTKSQPLFLGPVNDVNANPDLFYIPDAHKGNYTLYMLVWENGGGFFDDERVITIGEGSHPIDKPITRSDIASKLFTDSQILPHSGVGIYNFFLGETLKDALIQILSKNEKFSIYIANNYFNYLYFLPKYLEKPSMIKDLNVRNTNWISNNYNISINFISKGIDGIFNKASSKYPNLTIENISNSFEFMDKINRPLTGLSFTVGTSMRCTLVFMKHTSDFFQSKCIEIVLSDISDSTYFKIMDILAQRYGEFKTTKNTETIDARALFKGSAIENAMKDKFDNVESINIVNNNWIIGEYSYSNNMRKNINMRIYFLDPEAANIYISDALNFSKRSVEQKVNKDLEGI